MAFQIPFVPFPLEVWLNLDLLSVFIFICSVYVCAGNRTDTALHIVILSGTSIQFSHFLFTMFLFSVVVSAESILTQGSRLLHSYPLLRVARYEWLLCIYKSSW